MRPVFLIARREVRERLRARSFRIATVITVAIVVAGIAIPASQRGHRDTFDIGAVSEISSSRIAALERSLNVRLRVHSVTSPAAAEQGLRNGTLDIVVSRDEVVTKRPVDADSGKRAQVVAALTAMVGAQPVTTPVVVRALEGRESQGRQRITAFFGVLLLLIFFQQYGAWVLIGVVEEKTSRVVEVLLAAVRPRQLVAGKVAGIGAVALVQGATVAIAALVTSSVTGYHVFEGASRFLVLWTLVWFLLGYCFYSLLNAAVGSLVSRQADAQNAAFPVMMPMFVGYVTASSMLGGDVSPFARALSFLPPTAPLVMPMIIGLGKAPAWQIALSMALLVGAIVVVARVAGDVYARAILHTGRRLRFREVLRGGFSAA